MELIEALEQLSLHVKSSHNDKTELNDSVKSNIRQNELQNGTNFHQLPRQSTDETWRYNYFDAEVSFKQLKEFDNSIKTLCAQINELETQELDPAKQYNANFKRHCPNTNNFKPPITSRTTYLSGHNSGGSLETSQEEDSDNSSQQSGCQTTDCTNPFVKELLKRDLGAITDTVRKIGRILTIGDEIESIYKIHFTQCQSECIFTRKKSNQINIDYSKSLCNTFIDLCSDEPYICDLPTIIRYNQFCKKLANNLYILEGSTGSIHFGLMTDANSMASLIEPIESGESVIVSSDNDEFMCLDQASDALDCALLECEQRNLNNHWTENKLYINQPSNSNDNIKRSPFR